MNDQFADIFTETHCPEQSQLLAYVNGTLTPAERHEVELHLQDCGMCAEAVEGLQAITEKERIPGWLRQAKWELLRKLRRKTHKKREVNLYLFIAIVALIVLLLAIGLWWGYHFSR
ncbi:anti-sigma factor family protein [Chitinophaga lutea]